MLKFNSFVALMEAKREQGVEPKTAVFAFLRCNPPTQGHAKVIHAVESLAKQKTGDPFIFLSRSHDTDKNPLTFADKIEFMRRMFPNTNFVDNTTEEIKNPFHASGYLGTFLKYTDAILVAGSDRVAEYQKRFNNPEKYYDSFQVVSAGERDPDVDGVAGMSGTRARLAAVQDNEVGFKDATGWNDEAADWLFKAVRRGMQ